MTFDSQINLYYLYFYGVCFFKKWTLNVALACGQFLNPFLCYIP